jgi:uncharacterized protein YjbJ (UPF0337 family)
MCASARTQYPAGHQIRNTNQRSSSNMNKDKIEGTARQVLGTIKETAGKVLDNARLETEGKIDKAAGTIQKAAGDIKEAVVKSVDTPR